MTFVGTITEQCKVSDISNNFSYGQIVEIGNIPMRTLIRWSTRDNGDYLGVHTFCPGTPISNLWYFKARVTFHLMRRNEQALTNTIIQCFEVSVTSWGLSLIPKEELYNPANGYVTNGAIKIVVDIEISDAVGFHKKGVTDFSIPQNIETEVALCFGELKLYADKCALMCFSSVFREMLTSEDSKEIEIKDSNYQHFATFLRALNQGLQITNTNIETVLTLAIRYDVQSLISQCEDFLASSETISIAEKIRLAEVHLLSGLQTKIVENVTKDDLKKVHSIMTKIGGLTAQLLLLRMCGIEKN